MSPDDFQQPPLVQKRHNQNSDASLIPMINIVFLLLIFFMVAGQIKASPNPQLLLPFTDMGKAAEEQPHRLEIAVTGELVLDGKNLSLAEFAHILATWDTASTQIALLADKRLPARQLDEVLSVIRSRGIAKVQLFSDNLERQQ